MSTALPRVARLTAYEQAEKRGEPKIGKSFWWVVPVAIGLGARLILAATLPIMFDEAWSIRHAVHLSSDTFLGASGDAHPPLSYLLFAGWGLVNWSIGWFRSLAVMVSLAAIYPSALLARRVFGERAVKPTVWILAVWPLPLYAGWNIAYYGFLVLLSAVYLLCWARPLAGERALPEHPVLTSVLEVLLIHTAYTSLPLIVVLNGYGIWRLFVLGEWRPSIRWSGRGLVVIVLCIPQFLVYRSIAESIARQLESYPSLGLLPDLVVALKAMILTELPYWHDAAFRPLWLLPAVIIGLAGVGLWRNGRRTGPPLIVTFMTILLVAIGIGTGLRRVGQYYFQVLPLAAAVIGGGLAGLPRAAGAAAIAAVASVSILRLVDPAYHYAFSDTRSVAQMLDRLDRATPVVYLDNQMRALTDVTQLSRPRLIAIVTDEADASRERAPGVAEERLRSSTSGVFDRPLLFQPATGVYAERWSRRRWNATLAHAEVDEIYLVVPVEARGTAAVRAESIERGRRAADGILAAGQGAWQIRESQFPGTLIFHLRRAAGVSR